MVALLRQKDVQVLTKDGECVVTIQLDLNINLTSEGVAGLSVNARSKEQEFKAQDEDQVDWAIPDFKKKDKSGFKFGKKVEE